MRRPRWRPRAPDRSSGRILAGVSFADHLLVPWLDRLREQVDGLDLFDAHTHIGRNDPDGFKQELPELIETLTAADARAVVFPMHEPEGYAAANDEVLEAAAAAAGRLVAFCRVDPHTDAVGEASRALDAGARGIKLHPRAEGFTLHHPGIGPLIALAHERSVPVLIHAGRGIPALGRDTVRLSGEFDQARLILAHAAISDLAWLWRVMPEHPNLFIDTAWWSPTDLLALFMFVPPGQILFASDSPYGTAVSMAVIALRCALQAGLTHEQLREVAGRQLERVLSGEPPLDLGPAPQRPIPWDPLLARAAESLVSAAARRLAGGSDEESIALARLACAVGEDDERAEVAASVLELIDRAEAHRMIPDGRPLSDLHVLVAAATVARTPDVPLPDVRAEPAPERDQIRA